MAMSGERLERFWHDQAFYKPPRHPGVVTRHRDYSYWTRTSPPGHLTCWIGAIVEGDHFPIV
jgi:hypothetical protein